MDISWLRRNAIILYILLIISCCCVVHGLLPVTEDYGGSDDSSASIIHASSSSTYSNSASSSSMTGGGIGKTLGTDNATNVSLLTSMMSSSSAEKQQQQQQQQAVTASNSGGVQSPHHTMIDLYPRNITHIYKGDWVVINGTNATNLSFEKNAGHTLFYIANMPVETTHEFDYVEGEMVIRDGVYTTDTTKKYILHGIYEYINGLLTLIAIPINVQYTIAFDFNNQTTPTTVKNNLNSILSNFTSTTDCVFKVDIQIASNLQSSEENSNIEKQVHVLGEYISPYCHLDLKVNASSILDSVYQAKRINYVLMVTLCSFIQIFVLIKQMDYTGTQSGAAKVSLYTIGMQTILDAYLCLVHLTAGVIIESMFNAFATAAFFQFVCFSLFEMRYLLVILKARRPQAFADGWNSLRREFSVFYLRFYSFLIGGFIIIYYLSHLFNLFVFFLFSFWVPQIINNAQRSARRPFLWQYIIGTSFSRLAIPLYFYGCPHNFITFEPNYSFSLILFFWMCFQVAVLYAQDKYGPQFFIPKRFLPPKYYYTRPISTSLLEESQGCVICMNDVEANDTDYMITPCEHLFHARCLQQWMDYKLECPTCRRSLPPP